MAGCIGVLHDHTTNFASGDVLHLHGAGFPAALDERDDLSLVAITALSLPAVLGMQNPGWRALNVALEGLVNLKGLAFAAERAGTAFVHRLADTMTDEPAGLDIDAENAMKLVRADPLLAGADEMNRLEPDMQWNVARFEDGPDLDGERFPAGIALVYADPGALALERPRAINYAAVWAYPSIRPDLRLDVGVCGALIAETGFV